MSSIVCLFVCFGRGGGVNDVGCSLMILLWADSIPGSPSLPTGSGYSLRMFSEQANGTRATLGTSNGVRCFAILPQRILDQPSRLADFQHCDCECHRVSWAWPWHIWILFLCEHRAHQRCNSIRQSFCMSPLMLYFIGLTGQFH